MFSFVSTVLYFQTWFKAATYFCTLPKKRLLKTLKLIFLTLKFANCNKKCTEDSCCSFLTKDDQQQRLSLTSRAVLIPHIYNIFLVSTETINQGPFWSVSLEFVLCEPTDDASLTPWLDFHCYSLSYKCSFCTVDAYRNCQPYFFFFFSVFLDILRTLCTFTHHSQVPWADMRKKKDQWESERILKNLSNLCSKIS